MARRTVSEITRPMPRADAGLGVGGLSGAAAAAAARSTSGRLPAVLAALGAVLVLYLAVPFVVGLASLDRADTVASARDAVKTGAVGVSVVTATVSTAIAAVLGVPLAYVLARADFRGKALVAAAVYLPLVVPPLAGGLLLLTVFGPHGFLGGWFDARNIQIADAWPGIVLAQVFVAAPFLIVAAQVAFAGVDPALERVSYALGVPPLATFFRVSLPLAWPGILAGLPLVWLRALGEFGATVMLAYHPYSLPVYLFVQFGAQGLRAALPIAAVLAVLGIAALAAVRAAAGRTRW
ncbi:MAG TPA: ABC transporter permease [bacterium]|nr:ABC transporter permease [bacterium]